MRFTTVIRASAPWIPTFSAAGAAWRGYIQGDAANKIFRHTPARPHGQDRAERIDYSPRLTGYAFSAVGDIHLAAVRPTPEQIEVFRKKRSKVSVFNLYAIIFISSIYLL